MSYSTGVPSSTANLIASLVNFLVSDGGFTLSNTWSFTASPTNVDAPGSTTYTARAVSRDGQFVVLSWKTTSPDILTLNTCSATPSSGRPNLLTDAAPLSQYIELGTSPLRYHFFSDGDSTNAAVEWLGGAYQHINIGALKKYGAFTGGLYVTGTYWNRGAVNFGNYGAWDSSNHNRPFDALNPIIAACGGHVRVNYLAQPVAFFGYQTPVGNIVFGMQLLSMYMLNRSPNAYNGRAVLVPIEILLGLEDSLSPTHYKPLGRVENAAYVNITNLNVLEEILTDWVVFPLSAKNSGGTVASGYINSLNYGIAYRK